MSNNQNALNRNEELNQNANTRLAILRRYLRTAENTYREGLEIITRHRNLPPDTKRRMNAALRVRAQNIKNTKAEIERWEAAKTMANMAYNLHLRKTAAPLTNNKF